MPSEMDIEEATASLTAGKAAFDEAFDSKIVNAVTDKQKEGIMLRKALNLSGKMETDVNESWTEAQLATGKYALSNMLGSMSYMHGDRMVLKDGLVVKEPNATLFTGVPDRPDHARGFMWDEGFHQHLISVWDMNLTMEIIESWFS